jgi:hypothetical protein
MSKGSKKGKTVTVVTPRMLRAGALALATMGGDASDYELVGTVYRAMAAVAPQQTKVAMEASPPDNFLEVLRILSAGKRNV